MKTNSRINAELLSACQAALVWFEREADMCQRAGGDKPDSTPLDAYSTDCGEGENKMDVAALRNAIANAQSNHCRRNCPA